MLAEIVSMNFTFKKKNLFLMEKKYLLGSKNGKLVEIYRK